MVQNTINRMANSSFLIRGWAVTIIAAMFALAAKDVNAQYVLISYFSIPILWILDAFYLHQEKCYRSLFEVIGKRRGQDTDFSMNAREFEQGVNAWICTVFSKTTLIFYGGIVLLVLLVMFGIEHG